VSAPLVSIVLLTRNGAETLPETLDAIARQRADFAYEVVAIDSGSTDATLALLEQLARPVIRIPPASFNHGLTRNLAVEHARGELIVFLVQDALPVSDDWLVRLTAPLRTNRDVAGAFCRQQARPHASALTRRYLDRWIAASATPRAVKLATANELDRLDPAGRLHMCAFDNVCSCIRRSVWQTIPFPEAPIAEDVEWGRAVLLAGYRIDYVTDAVVLHSHERSARDEFARTYALHRQLLLMFGLRTIPTSMELARAVLSSVRLHLACERQAVRAGNGRAGLKRALGLAVAWPLGQYLGALSASKGWKPMRVEGA
jgi:rhamnosyltransferase